MIDHGATQKWHLNGPALEAFRREICLRFIAFKRNLECTQQELAELAGLDEPKISKILNQNIKEFSTDRLLLAYERLNPKVKLRIR